MVTVQNDCVDVIPVAAIYENGIRMAYCYDEPEASSLHKHNVRLKNSPDVFTAINRIIDINNILRLDNVYVKADWDELLHILLISSTRIKIIDNGIKISESDWEEICNHMHISQLQKEFERADNTKSDGMDFDFF